MPNYEDLLSKIVGTGLCTRCGACFSACPNNFIKFISEKPNWDAARKEECTWCDKCYNACYMVRHELIKELGRIVFGRAKKEHIGVYRHILSARTRDEEVKQVCQDGGIVTSFLIHLLEEKLIDGALVAEGDGWMPVDSVARIKEQVIRAAGTKYGMVPILKGLKAAVGEHGLSRICVVGSPCHIQSVRYLQHSGSPLASIVKYTVGLLCRENYEYHCIEGKVEERGLNMEDVDKFVISEEFTIWAKGEKISYPIALAKSWVPKHCLICEDFAAELADISIGSDGSPEGWSTVIVRTEEGENIFSAFEGNKVIETKPLLNFDYIREIADRKREKGKQTRDIFRLREKGLKKKEIAIKLGITEERVVHRLKRF